MRRFLDRVAIYFGLKDDGSSAPAAAEPLTARAVLAIVLSAVVVIFSVDAIRASISGARFDFADDIWHAAILSIALVALRYFQYRFRPAQGTLREKPDVPPPV